MVGGTQDGRMIHYRSGHYSIKHISYPIKQKHKQKGTGVCLSIELNSRKVNVVVGGRLSMQGKVCRALVIFWPTLGQTSVKGFHDRMTSRQGRL